MCQGYGRGVAECRNFARSIARRFANFFKQTRRKLRNSFRRANVSFDGENGNEREKKRGIAFDFVRREEIKHVAVPRVCINNYW